MRRREIIKLLGSAAGALPFAAHGQQSPTPVIGLLSAGSPIPYEPYVNAIRQGLSEAGYTEGRNVAIEYRWANTRLDRLPALAAELVERRVSLIITSGGVPPALAAKAATSTIPIVFHMGDDPVRVGVVASLNRPGGNVTGVSFLSFVSGTKRLELLNALVPKAATIGILFNPDNPGATPTMEDLRSAADVLHLKLYGATASTARGIEETFASLPGQRVDALFVAPDTLFRVQLSQLIALAAQHAIPTMYVTRDFVEAGGLISYGADITDAYRQEGAYAGRILMGAKPADLPVMQSTKFELVLNLKTAKQLGLGVSDKLLSLADKVIE
jgi:putative tryptophan/tyrosine transport system substrate-binding protein